MNDSLYFNPSCSKCRTAWSMLEDLNIDARQVRYLDVAPTMEQLTELMGMLAIASPREMMRTGEAIYTALGLEGADDKELLTAIMQHPVLLERPIFVHRGRAVIARPPERIRELLDESSLTK